MQGQKVLIAIPVFNEADATDIIKRVRKYNTDVLVVDDGSTVGIGNNLKAVGNVYSIVHSRNYGYGKTIIDAFEFAIIKNYDYLITIDSDGQHEPEEISLFLSKIPFNDYDILSGTRYLFPVKLDKEVPQERYYVNKEVTEILNQITGFNLTDSFCGFKAYKVDKLKVLHLTESGYGMPLQLWIQAWKHCLKVKEIPVKLVYKDLSKRFKGLLENPEARLSYYKRVINKELFQ